MNVLVVCQYYYPESFQITPICEQLVKDGYGVTVLTGLPNYPTGVVPEEYRKGHREETINGVHVIRCFEIGRKKSIAYLAFNYLSFWHSALRQVGKLTSDYDVVFVYQLSPVMMGLPGRKYAIKHNVPLFLYCCDLWPESMRMYIHNERNPIYKLFRAISKRVYSSCDKIACQSSSFIPYLHEIHGIDTHKLTYIPAFADETYLSADFDPVYNKCTNFVFLGNLGIAQDLLSVLSAVEKMKDVPNFKVHFVGDGTCFEEMKTFVKEHQMRKCVEFYGRRPVDEMPRFYKMADACIVSLKADDQTGWTLPLKMQGYMAAGKPIIGMIDGSSKTVIEEAKCGICVAAGDIDSFAGAMKDFIENKGRYSKCGESGRAYFKKNFSKRIVLDKIEKELNRLGR